MHDAPVTDLAEMERVAHEKAAETHRQAQAMQVQHAEHSRQLAERRGG